MYQPGAGMCSEAAAHPVAPQGVHRADTCSTMMLGALALQEHVSDGIAMQFSRTELLKGLAASLMMATLLIGCQATPASCPETESIETTVAGQVFATLTAEAPTSTSSPCPDAHLNTGPVQRLLW